MRRIEHFDVECRRSLSTFRVDVAALQQFSRKIGEIVIGHGHMEAPSARPVAHYNPDITTERWGFGTHGHFVIRGAEAAQVAS